MRTTRYARFLSILALFLALLFGIRELPELMSLADDVWNDGGVIQFIAPDDSSVMSSDNHARELAAHGIRSSEFAPVVAIPFPRIPPRRSGKRLLELFSLLRL